MDTDHRPFLHAAQLLEQAGPSADVTTTRAEKCRMSVGAARLKKWIEEITSCDRLDVEVVFQNKLADRGWLDHWGTVEYQGHEFLVSERYCLGREGTVALMKFCDHLDLDFEIQAASRHYPSQTLRIIIGPKNSP